MEQEIRAFSCELRACGKDKKDRIIEGRAIPFNVFSPNREGFREMIAPGAVEGVIEKSDIFMTYNHSKDNGFLARSNKGKGSLVIDVTDEGVNFMFEAGNDNLSNYVLERIERGDLGETSFAFTVAEDRWVKAEDGVYERTITKFDRLYDLSIVDQSYYGIANAVKCARFAEIQEEERIENEKKLEELKAEEERKAAEEKEQKLAELADYYSQIKEEYKDYLK